jgi:hypothetical protein
MKIHALGLCGVDDSVHPNQLVMYAHLYPLVEFGVLFRPDREGQPRYPTKEWVALLSETAGAKNHNPRNRNKMKLAAHLCERRVDEVLRGDDSFVSELYEWGFGRVQINATAVNGVDTSVFDKHPTAAIKNFLAIVHHHPELEFILQKNDETRPLWEGVLIYTNINNIEFPSNVSMLLDESKGTGVLPKTWPPIPPDTTYKIGYAGGIGPSNVSEVLSKIREAVAEVGDKDGGFWIDMESSLRSQKDGQDVFDLDKCYTVIMEVCREGYFSHPPFLVSSFRPEEDIIDSLKDSIKRLEKEFEDMASNRNLDRVIEIASEREKIKEKIQQLEFRKLTK